MTTALIGYTGFVGSTLGRQRSFTHSFNSKNIHEIKGLSFDLVVCAGVSAVKWLANREPEADRAAIEGLTVNLNAISAKHFVLVSTIDVYRDPKEVTELNIPSPEGLHPYGLHRLLLEKFAAQRFEKHTIVRLPGLFGTGLRKNVIFDFLNQNQTERISPDGRLQWYPMRRFCYDLERIIRAAPGIINLAPEPISTKEIQRHVFPDSQIGKSDLPATHYDIRTVMAGLLDGEGDYHLNATAVMTELHAYVRAERARRSCV